MPASDRTPLHRAMIAAGTGTHPFNKQVIRIACLQGRYLSLAKALDVDIKTATQVLEQERQRHMARIEAGPEDFFHTASAKLIQMKLR